MTKLPRINRKELRNPDEFIKKGSRFIRFLSERRSPFLLVASLAALTISLFYGYDYWNARKLTRAWKELVRVEKLEGPARWDELKKLHQAHAGLRPGSMAAVLVADHLFDSARKEWYGDPEKARPVALEAAQWYGNARQFSELLPTEKQLLGVDRGGALELAGNHEEAMAEYKVASEIAGEAAAFALFRLAGIYEAQGDLPSAEQTYEKISVSYPASEFAKMAKNAIRRIKSPNFKPKPIS